MKNKLEALKNDALAEIASSKNLVELDNLRVKFLGKKGELTELMKNMKDLSKEDRPIIGKLTNEVKDAISDAIEQKSEELKVIERKLQLENEVIDITLPGRKVSKGGLHPITETELFIKEIFKDMGFDVADGPEIEQTYFNFDALNIPENHPSRDLQDTFYMSENVVLRTHTSPVQIRYMKEHGAPFRMICTGKVYRSDYDISHTPMFHQMEGLMVGENVSFANLKAILIEFVTRVFGEREVRFRPHFFPFTEPSAEMDVQCGICHGEGCRLCKHTGWLEIMGCGMVDPAVLAQGGFDSNKISGFAFGIGIERTAMLRYGIDDLRAFYENDMRFLKQFKK